MNHLSQSRSTKAPFHQRVPKVVLRYSIQRWHQQNRNLDSACNSECVRMGLEWESTVEGGIHLLFRHVYQFSPWTFVVVSRTAIELRGLPHLGIEYLLLEIVDSYSEPSTDGHSRLRGISVVESWKCCHNLTIVPSLCGDFETWSYMADPVHMVLDPSYFERQLGRFEHLQAVQSIAQGQPAGYSSMETPLYCFVVVRFLRDCRKKGQVVCCENKFD